MKYLLIAGALILQASPSFAVVCADGVYRASCVGPNGAATVRKPPMAVTPRVDCAHGVYRSGCATPNGAVVRRNY